MILSNNDIIRFMQVYVLKVQNKKFNYFIFIHSIFPKMFIIPEIKYQILKRHFINAVLE